MSDITTEFHAGERVIKEGMVDRMQDMLEHGGWLWLTNQRLIFKPRALKEPFELSFPLSEIVSAQEGRHGTSPVIVVRLTGGRQEDFRAIGSEDWIAQINAARASASDLTMPAARAAEPPPADVPTKGSAPTPPPPAQEASPSMFLRTRFAQSPFAGQERFPTVEMVRRMDRRRRTLLIIALVGLVSIILGGCVLLLFMVAIS